MNCHYEDTLFAAVAAEISPAVAQKIVMDNIIFITTATIATKKGFQPKKSMEM
jgi:hypothetical protein